MTDIITHDDSYGNLVPIEQLYPQFFTFRVSPPLAHEEPASPFEKGCARNTWKVAYTEKQLKATVFFFLLVPLFVSSPTGFLRFFQFGQFPNIRLVVVCTEPKLTFIVTRNVKYIFTRHRRLEQKILSLIEIRHSTHSRGENTRT